MPELDTERREIANQLVVQIASENKLTAPQARAFVRGLQTGWNDQPIAWSEAASRSQYLDAMRLINAASVLQSIDGTICADAQKCFRRSGEIFEWLSRAKDSIPTTFSLEILSAASYQLGGSPAMAAALLDHVEQKNAGENLYASFLRADFDTVIRLVADFWQKNMKFAERVEQPHTFQDAGENKFGWYVTVDLVRMLGLLSDSIRRGDTDRYDLATRKLSALSNFANQTFTDDVSLFLTLLNWVAARFAQASIYDPIRRFGELNVKRVRVLERFARKQFGRKRGILWASQVQGLERLINGNSFALCTPTGSGKTLVANMALVKELLLQANSDGALALYIVPSRALAGEVEAKLSDELGKEVIVTGLYGGTDWGVTDYWIEAKTPTVLIATVEKADALMRFLAPLLLRRLRLLILDEAHQVVPEDNDRTQDDFAKHSSRSLRLETFVSKLFARAPKIARIALTAVAGGAALPVAKWIEGGKGAEPVGSNFRSTRQLIGSFETRPSGTGRMLLEILNGESLSVEDRSEPVYINLSTPPIPNLSAVIRNSINRFNQIHVLWTALHLAEGGRRILISVAQQPEQTMAWFKDALNRRDWAGAPDLGRARSDDETRRFNQARATCIDYCGRDSYEVALLDKGIASNHGQMPQRVRRLMVDLIGREICPIAIATATLTEGVNLPFDIIFVPSLLRRSYNTAQKHPVENPMSTSEFRNLAGRAGRPGAGKGLEGITLVPIPTRPSASADRLVRTQRGQISKMRDRWTCLRQSLLKEELERQKFDSPLALLFRSIAKKAHNALKLQGDEFLEWLEKISPSTISPDVGCASVDENARLADSIDELDGVLLGALEELQRVDNDELGRAAVEEALSALWKGTFTVYASAQERWMEKAFIRRGHSVLEEIYPDRKERSRLYQYGFTPCVGKRFDEMVPVILARLKDTNRYGGATDAERIVVFIDLCGLIAQDLGFGFKVRSTKSDQKIRTNWKGVLFWWMRAPGYKSPRPQDLRSWQRFVTDNIEFRIGLGLGAVVAGAWSEGVDGSLETPSLEKWCATTKLPWFAFWARELLRWGTLDPLVAFALSEGLTDTRESGELLRPKYDAWLSEQKSRTSAEDRIDPQLFLDWRREQYPKDRGKIPFGILEATLLGIEKRKGQYPVIPVVLDDVVHWLDSAGFALASSSGDTSSLRGLNHRNDFLLRVNRNRSFVTWTMK